jgi:hypothetical protein
VGLFVGVGRGLCHQRGLGTGLGEGEMVGYLGIWAVGLGFGDEVGRVEEVGSGL